MDTKYIEMNNAMSVVANKIRDVVDETMGSREAFLVEQAVEALYNIDIELLEDSYLSSAYYDKRVFLAVWGADVQGIDETTGAKVEEHDFAFFCQANGYTLDMRVGIDMLGLGSCYAIDSTDGVHSIVRIK